MWRLLVIVSLISISCASGKCRQKKDEKTFIQQVENLPHFETKENHSIKAGDLDTVRIYKADGTKQCESNRPVQATEFKKRLEAGKIRVLKVEHTTDGVMHVQVCGSETGSIYVFDIQRLDLEKALKLGYKNYGDLKP